MDKAERHGMERLSLQREWRFSVAVYHISQKRMADLLHMHSDLMGPARLQPAFDIGVV